MHNLLIMALAPLALMHLGYLAAIKKNNFGLIDSIWGLGFILIALTGCILHHFNDWRENLVGLLVLIWGLRLSLYLHSRNAGKPEDYRYAQMRASWGSHANQKAYLRVFLLQYFLMLLISLPLLVVHQNSAPIGLLDYLGVVLWVIGFGWETVADYQKNKFKNQPGHQHKICQVGLWKYSRHPNYFGEATLWWGISLISASTGNYFGFLGVALLNFLLLKVSGVPLIEKRYENNPDYQAYKKLTPTLIPSILKLLELRK